MCPPRKKSLLLAGVGATVLAVASAARFAPWRAEQPPPDADAAAGEYPPIPVRPDSELPYRPYDYQLSTDQTIRVFEDRVRDDPNHLNLTHLGGLYVRKARESGDHAAYDKADAAFRRALAARPDHVSAKVGLALATCARHKFADGLKLAEEVYKDNPDQLDALAVIGDARLELGDYAGAEAAIRELERKGPKPAAPAILARVARLAELKGDPDRAVALLRQAEEAERAGHDFKQPVAWYRMRLGEVLFSQGRVGEAAGHLEAALKDHPDFPAALTALGRIRVAQGRDAEASDLFYRALRITPDIATMVAAADLHARRGEAVPAKAFFDEVEKLDTSPVATRDLVLYYCDHDRKLPRALELARAEADARKDIYTCDALAWALLKNGHPAEAEAVAAEALRLGTRDAVLFYHAGVIADSARKPEKAREWLERAVATNPHFSDRDARHARELLARPRPGGK